MKQSSCSLPIIKHVPFHLAMAAPPETHVEKRRGGKRWKQLKGSIPFTSSTCSLLVGRDAGLAVPISHAGTSPGRDAALV